ncbi:GIY-YIG nuclease family protein [Celeribacter marinus]|uniref:GIY-YIG nuclease family protein n=1 Tax=Celeribacter marinus TaxID=1397108 RepID=UPI00317D1EA6
MSHGRSVRLFLAEGTPTGVVTAEIVNWTGHVISAPRTKLEVALKRDEIRKTGVYILYGSPLDADLPQVYVGEGDDISTRLNSHSKDDNKAFWERFVAVTNKDMNLTKAHVKYLEGRLISLLKEAKKSEVTNKTEPTFDRLPEADISDMEAFLEHLQIVLPVIGVDFFRKTSSIPSKETVKNVPATIFELNHSRKGIFAKAQEIDGEFVVLEGATGSLNEAVSFSEKLKAMREQLISSGRITATAQDNFRLTEDIAFSSPSAAAVFLFGTSRNGRTDWLIEGQSQTYGDWKDEMINPRD